MSDAAPDTISQTQHRQLGVDLFNQTWTLLRDPGRSASDDLEMIHSAHASRFHWKKAGEPVNLARGEWQCSRVYSVLGRPEPALFHAERCLEICETNGIGDFDLAFAYEAIARALQVGGNTEGSSEALAKARAATRLIANPEDLAVVEADLDSLS